MSLYLMVGDGSDGESLCGDGRTVWCVYGNMGGCMVMVGALQSLYGKWSNGKLF